MEQITRLLLLVGLILSTIAALAYSVRILIGLVLGGSWFWGGAFAAYLGPIAFAGAMYLNELRLRVEKSAGLR